MSDPLDWTESTLTIKEADSLLRDQVEQLLRSTTLITTEHRKRFLFAPVITVTGPAWKLAEVAQAIQRLRDAHWLEYAG